jgi:hypothetical protein
MNPIGKSERATQDRVIALFRDQLGYVFLDVIVNEIAALEAKLAKVRQVKQGMMQELLTGKTRLV